MFTDKVENSGFFHCCSTFGSGLNTSCDGSEEVSLIVNSFNGDVMMISIKVLSMISLMVGAYIDW